MRKMSREDFHKMYMKKKSGEVLANQVTTTGRCLREGPFEKSVGTATDEEKRVFVGLLSK